MKRLKSVILSILSVVTSIIITILLPSDAAAEKGNQVPDLDELPKSLTVYFYVQNNGVDIAIEGASIGITRVAGLEVRNKSAEYTLLDTYKDADIDFTGMDVEKSIKAAKTLSSMIKEHSLVTITDYHGKSVFSGLKPGMYLVEELDAHGDAEKYEFFDPYIISVPLADATETVCKWKNDVLSEPKTIVKEKQISEPSESSEPSELSHFFESSEPSEPYESSDDRKIITGENSVWFVIIRIWLFSLILALVTVVKRKSREKND